MLITRVIIASVLIFSIIVTTIVSTIPSVSAISYYDQVLSNYQLDQSSNWKLGNGLTEGDYFVYKICSDNSYYSMMYQIIHPYHCYQVTLEFVTILESYQGKVWVVQGNLSIDDSTPDISSKMIFLIDSTTFEIYTDKLNVNLGNSIQNTIFSLSTYEKSLSIGTIWDQLDSYFTNKIPLEIKNKQSIQIPRTSLNGSNYDSNYSTVETSVLSYDIIVQSNTFLHNDFPFPLKAVMYSPHIIYPEPVELYYYELLEYSRGFTIP